MDERTLEALRNLPMMSLPAMIRPLHQLYRELGDEEVTREEAERALRSGPPPPPILKTREEVRALLGPLMQSIEKTSAVLTTLEWHALSVEELQARLEALGIDEAHARAVAYDESRELYRAARRQSVHDVARLMGYVLRVA